MLVASQNRRQGSLLSGLLLGNTIFSSGIFSTHASNVSDQYLLSTHPIHTPYTHILLMTHTLILLYATNLYSCLNSASSFLNALTYH